MKKIILVTMVAMLSVSAFSEEVHNEMAGAVACDVENQKVIDVDTTSTKSNDNGTTLEGN